MNRHFQLIHQSPLEVSDVRCVNIRPASLSYCSCLFVFLFIYVFVYPWPKRPAAGAGNWSPLGQEESGSRKPPLTPAQFGIGFFDHSEPSGKVPSVVRLARKNTLLFSSSPYCTQELLLANFRGVLWKHSSVSSALPPGPNLHRR